MDRFAIDQLGISGLELMRRAGQEAFRVLTQMCPPSGQVMVFCGAGNNAGDGYVVARLAREAGYPVRVRAIVSPEKLAGDAAAVYREFVDQGGTICLSDAEIRASADIVVDALLGTGLDRPVSGRFEEVIREINCFEGPVLALDVPSGLNADTGCPMGVAVRADRTVTFIGAKQGLYTGDGVDYSGEVCFVSLDVPASVVASETPSAGLLGSPQGAFARRARSAHKGQFGHVLIVGGNSGYSGAACMAGKASARVGAGLISLATRASHASFMTLGQPELMCHGVESADQLDMLLARATVVGIGPGLGQDRWSRTLFDAVRESSVPLVIDADALNLLAQSPFRRTDWVLTPHPGEAARLLDTDTAAIRNDRFAAVIAIQEQYGGTCLLKGVGTLIADGNVIAVCPTGNPGMASGGMGDVLTGVIAGLIAQGFDIGDAARAGAYLHGEAADMAAVGGERGLLATDLLLHLYHLVNP